MKCVRCGGLTEIKHVEHKEFGMFLGRFKAEVCMNCGEKYYGSKSVAAIQHQSKARGFFGIIAKNYSN